MCRVPTVMENPGKSWKKKAVMESHGKVMENSYFQKSHGNWKMVMESHGIFPKIPVSKVLKYAQIVPRLQEIVPFFENLCVSDVR